MVESTQTNLQLYNRLVTLGWPSDDLRRARDAYELAAGLFSGQYRCSGKTFVAHLVGTAGVVAATDGRVDLVLAGLLHAAYENGDFGAGRRATHELRRATVRRAVGTTAEALVDAYSTTPWDVSSLDRAVADATRGSSIHATRRDVLLLRIANEIDEHADFGTRFCDKGGLEMYRKEALQQMAVLADALGAPRLAGECRRVVDDEPRAVVPEVLRSDGRAAAVVVPASYGRRPSVWTRSVLRRGRRALRHVPGVRR
jgi:(p)ppGpp synthase/HD superfamily hydrolase